MKKNLLLIAFCWAFTAAQAQMFILPLVKNSACGNNGGSIEVFVGGGTFPYSYSWTNGATTSINNNLAAGSYRVYVTDAGGDTTSLQADVFNDAFIETAYAFLDYDPSVNFYYSCRSICNGGYRAVESLLNGTAPYNFVALNGTQQTLPNGNGIAFLGHCTGDTVQVIVTDANGCIGNFNQLLYGPTHPEMRVINVQGSCNNGNSGSATFRIPNESAGFTGNVTYEVYSLNTGITPVQLTAASGVYQAFNLPQGNYSLNRVYTSAYLACEDDTIEFSVPSYGEYCATLSGIVWDDTNGDCLYDSILERGMPNELLKIMPGSSYVLTDAKGNYNITLPFGNYTVEWLYDIAVPTCNSNAQIPFTLSYQNPNTTTNFSGGSSALCNLLSSLQEGSGSLNPGSTYSLQVNYANMGGATSNATKLYLYFDPIATFQNASVTPDSVGTGVLMWNLGNLQSSNSNTSIGVNFSISNGASAGTIIENHSSIGGTTTDFDLSNNISPLNITVGTALFDANKKYVFDALGNKINLMYVDQDNTLNYTINFQNTTVDTVYNLTIVDTLSQYLDLATFQVVSSSALCQLSIDSARVARFHFPGILLPSNAVSELGSRGYVRYAVDVPPSFAGFQAHVYNHADIYFDTHQPFETNITDVLIDIFVGVKNQIGQSNSIKIFPNPAKDKLFIQLNSTPSNGEKN